MHWCKENIITLILLLVPYPSLFILEWHKPISNREQESSYLLFINVLCYQTNMTGTLIPEFLTEYDWKWEAVGDDELKSGWLQVAFFKGSGRKQRAGKNNRRGIGVCVKTEIGRAVLMLDHEKQKWITLQPRHITGNAHSPDCKNKQWLFDQFSTKNHLVSLYRPTLSGDHF